MSTKARSEGALSPSDLPYYAGSKRRPDLLSRYVKMMKNSYKILCAFASLREDYFGSPLKTGFPLRFNRLIRARSIIYISPMLLLAYIPLDEEALDEVFNSIYGNSQGI